MTPVLDNTVRITSRWTTPDAVVWMTTGTTHVARAEEWPIMPTEWVHTLLKPWNFFDETPTLGALKPCER